MKKLIVSSCFIVFIIFSFSLQAQDKKAKDLLNKVTAIVKGYDNIIIDFKYTLNNTKENINQDE